VADEPGKAPAPRPRRRRSDIDPTFKPPKVANERRRSKTTAAPPDTELAASDLGAGSAVTSVPAERMASTSDEDATAAVAAALVAEPPAPGVPGDPGGSWLPMLEDRSPNPAVCPFLRSADGSRMTAPVESPDIANRCAALREAVPQSLRQQELVCLGAAHVNCPRYLRGAAAVTTLPPPVVRPRGSLTPAVIVSLVVLIGAFVLSIAFVASRGGVDVAAIASGAPAASASGPGAASTDGSLASPTPTTTPPPATAATSGTPEPTPAPTASPPPTAAPSDGATAAPSTGPTPSSDRYALLVPCPDAPDCWIYTVRSGDNLFSIANYFGVQLKTVETMNPWVASGLRAGRELRIPTPTR
jgi:LysM domain